MLPRVWYVSAKSCEAMAMKQTRYKDKDLLLTVEHIYMPMTQVSAKPKTLTGIYPIKSELSFSGISDLNAWTILAFQDIHCPRRHPQGIGGKIDSAQVLEGKDGPGIRKLEKGSLLLIVRVDCCQGYYQCYCA